MSGVDEYVKTLLHFNEDLTDSSASGHVFTAQEGASISATGPKFGAGCLLLDGTNYVTGSDHADFSFGYAPFSLETFVEINSIQECQHFMSSGVEETALWYFGFNGDGENGIYFVFRASPFGELYSSHINVTAGYHHAAVVRSGTTIYFFWDFVLVSTETIGIYDEVNAGGEGFVIGARHYHGSTIIEPLDGKLDELRISKGIARGTTSYPAVTEEYAADIPAGYIVRRRLSTEHGFHPTLIGGSSVNTNKLYFHAPKTYAILISENAQNINLRDEVDALGYDGTQAIVTCEIALGVTIDSVDDATPAFDTGEFPEGFLRISITNRGSILGYDTGGTALFAQADILFNNLGTVLSTGDGYVLDGLSFIQWETVGNIRGLTNGDFFGYHTRVSSLRRSSKGIFPEDILRGSVSSHRAKHMHNLYPYLRTFIQSYRVADSTLNRYELYLNGSTSPDATSSTLPFTKELDIPISGTEEISILVKRRNRFGLVSFNQDPIVLEMDSYGNEDLGPLTKPTIMYLQAIGVGSLVIRASYADGQDRNPADKWNLFVKEGSTPDPEIDSPAATGNILRSGAGGTIQIATAISGLTSGSTAYVIMQIYREADGRYSNSDSDSETIFTAPTISSVSASMFGGSTIEIQ